MKIVLLVKLETSKIKIYSGCVRWYSKVWKSDALATGLSVKVPMINVQALYNFFLKFIHDLLTIKIAVDKITD